MSQHNAEYSTEKRRNVRNVMMDMRFRKENVSSLQKKSMKFTVKSSKMVYVSSVLHKVFCPLITHVN